MIRYAIGAMLLAALLTGPAMAGKKVTPKLTEQAKDGAQITRENIVKMKIRTVKPHPPPTPSLPLVPPPTPSVN